MRSKFVYPLNGGILHGVFYARVDVLVGAVTHEGCFVKSTKDQFEFIFISIDIPNGIYTGYVGAVIFSIHHDGVFIEVEAPAFNGPEFRT